MEDFSIFVLYCEMPLVMTIAPDVQELRKQEGGSGEEDTELSLVTSANAVKLILLGDSAVGKTKSAPNPSSSL